MSNIIYLSRAAFQTPPALKIEDVPLPEFGEGATVRILELSAEEAQIFGDRVSKEEDKFAMPLWIIASAHTAVPKTEGGGMILDGGGKQVFETGEKIFEDTPECRATILGMGASIVMRLGNTALRLNGFTKEKAEEETKN